MSEESDYCSVCGVAMTSPGIVPSPARASVTPPAPGASGHVSANANVAAGAGGAVGAFCPDCGEPRTAAARFCEVCRFDFVSGNGAAPQARALAAPPVQVPAGIPPRPPSVRPSAPPPSKSANAQTSAADLELVVATDPAIDTEPDADTPKVASEIIVPFGSTELLVGRRDDRRDIHPDIAVDDPGASRRHAKFVRLVDGSVAMQDLASTNGTKINDAEVTPGTRKTLAIGDAVTIGRWTRITLRLPKGNTP